MKYRCASETCSVTKALVCSKGASNWDGMARKADSEKSFITAGQGLKTTRKGHYQDPLAAALLVLPGL